MNDQRKGDKMAISLFERTEKKYVLSRTRYAELFDRIGDKLSDDAYPRSVVSSIYYDDPQDTMINRSNEKPLYKEKLRLRAYCPVSAGDAVFVELKKKFKGITYKRRVQLARDDAYAYMNGLPYEIALEHSLERGLDLPALDDWQTAQIVREIDATLARYRSLSPSMMIIVDRLAKRTNDGSDVRVTFDIDARWRQNALRFESGMQATPLFPDGDVIMEVKCQGSYPLWMARAFADMKLYPQPCSKVGIAYTRAHATGAQKEVYCA